MVGAGKPQGIIALHPSPSDENILQSVVKGVAHMKLTRDIRRRDNYAVRLLFGVNLRVEIFALKPEVVNPVFHIFGIILFCKFFCHIYSSVQSID